MYINEYTPTKTAIEEILRSHDRPVSLENLVFELRERVQNYRTLFPKKELLTAYIASVLKKEIASCCVYDQKRQKTLPRFFLRNSPVAKAIGFTGAFHPAVDGVSAFADAMFQVYNGSDNAQVAFSDVKKLYKKRTQRPLTNSELNAIAGTRGLTRHDVLRDHLSHLVILVDDHFDLVACPKVYGLSRDFFEQQVNPQKYNPEETVQVRERFKSANEAAVNEGPEDIEVDPDEGDVTLDDAKPASLNSTASSNVSLLDQNVSADSPSPHPTNQDSVANAMLSTIKEEHDRLGSDEQKRQADAEREAANIKQSERKAAEKREQEERERLATEEQERVAAEQREREAAEQRERECQAEEERQRQEAEQRERLAAEERERKAAEQREHEAALKREREAAEKRERERKAEEERQRQEAEERERKAAEQRERETAEKRERKAIEKRQREEEEKRERERKAEEERQRQEAEQRERERLAAEERERKAAEQREREAAEKREREAAEKRERERKAEEERQRQEAEQRERERLAAEERERKAAEKREREAAEKRERERLAAEQRERERQAEEERQRQEAEQRERERLAAEERERKAAEKREREAAEKRERERLAAEQRERERKAEEERQRQEAEQRERLAAEERERERLAAEERERERLAAEERERKTAEERERKAAEKREREAAEKRERERLAAEQREREAAEKRERERQAEEERQRQEAEQREREAAEQRERERKAEEERQRQEAEQRKHLAAEERERERLAAEERERKAAEERERKAAEECERKAAEQREREAAVKREREAAEKREREAAEKRERERKAIEKRQREEEEKRERERIATEKQESERQAAEERELQERLAAKKQQSQTEQLELAREVFEDFGSQAAELRATEVPNRQSFEAQDSPLHIVEKLSPRYAPSDTESISVHESQRQNLNNVDDIQGQLGSSNNSSPKPNSDVLFAHMREELIEKHAIHSVASYGSNSIGMAVSDFSPLPPIDHRTSVFDESSGRSPSPVQKLNPSSDLEYAQFGYRRNVPRATDSTRATVASSSTSSMSLDVDNTQVSDGTGEYGYSQVISQVPSNDAADNANDSVSLELDYNELSAAPLRATRFFGLSAPNGNESPQTSPVAVSAPHHEHTVESITYADAVKEDATQTVSDASSVSAQAGSDSSIDSSRKRRHADQTVVDFSYADVVKPKDQMAPASAEDSFGSSNGDKENVPMHHDRVVIDLTYADAAKLDEPVEEDVKQAAVAPLGVSQSDNELQGVVVTSPGDTQPFEHHDHVIPVLSYAGAVKHAVPEAGDVVSSENERSEIYSEKPFDNYLILRLLTGFEHGVINSVDGKSLPAFYRDYVEQDIDPVQTWNLNWNDVVDNWGKLGAFEYRDGVLFPNEATRAKREAHDRAGCDDCESLTRTDAQLLASFGLKKEGGELLNQGSPTLRDDDFDVHSVYEDELIPISEDIEPIPKCSGFEDSASEVHAGPKSCLTVRTPKSKQASATRVDQSDAAPISFASSASPKSIPQHRVNDVQGQPILEKAQELQEVGLIAPPPTPAENVNEDNDVFLPGDEQERSHGDHEQSGLNCFHLPRFSNKSKHNSSSSNKSPVDKNQSVVVAMEPEPVAVTVDEEDGETASNNGNAELLDSTGGTGAATDNAAEDDLQEGNRAVGISRRYCKCCTII